jgi:hypothetical protein
MASVPSSASSLPPFASSFGADGADGDTSDEEQGSAAHDAGEARGRERGGGGGGGDGGGDGGYGGDGGGGGGWGGGYSNEGGVVRKSKRSNKAQQTLPRKMQSPTSAGRGFEKGDVVEVNSNGAWHAAKVVDVEVARSRFSVEGLPCAHGPEEEGDEDEEDGWFSNNVPFSSMRPLRRPLLGGVGAENLPP